jgi:CBS domain-containing protein
MTAGLDTSLGTPPLADAIDRHPLIVAPNACLMDAVALMNETANHTHDPADVLHGARSSCVLVMQGESLQGIFTERDLVQLTAFGIDLHTARIADVMHHPVLTIAEQALHDIFAALFLFRRPRDYG